MPDIPYLQKDQALQNVVGERSPNQVGGARIIAVVGALTDLNSDWL